MSVIGLCGFNGLSAEYDDITVSAGSVSYDTVIPNASTTSSIYPGGGAALEARVPWQGAATDEFWIHAHIQRGTNDTFNDGNRVGWASGATVLGWASIEDSTLAWTLFVNGSVVDTSASTASIGTWHSLLIHVKLDAAAGFVRLYADGNLGTPVASFTGNTDPTAAATADRFYLRLQGGTNARLANLVAMDPTDATGVVDENKLLNLGIKGLAPDADGTYSAWTPDTGVVGYTQIDEAPPDDADFVEASAVGQRSTFSMSTVGTPSSVLAAKWCSRIRRQGTVAGSQVQITRRLSATDYDEAAVAAPGAGYVFDLWDQKPGGGDWTASDLDSTEFGVVSAT